mmetsp:Transcript_25123/g.51092  ORF Transcript_25123/g.51092 Transcript_25123/m.51092 type:complete len:104 (-) Transcript_25123:1190-1501(-)
MSNAKAVPCGVKLLIRIVKCYMRTQILSASTRRFDTNDLNLRELCRLSTKEMFHDEHSAKPNLPLKCNRELRFLPAFKKTIIYAWGEHPYPRRSECPASWHPP